MKIKLTKKRKNIIWLLVMVVTLVAGLLTTYHYIKHPETLSITISPYCKTLPANTQNVLELQDDSNGCPHWYFELISVISPCCCYNIDNSKYCAGTFNWDNIQLSLSNGVCYIRGNPSSWNDCSTYLNTPISNYGGLLDGYDCTKDLICSNSSVILKNCINGKYTDTGNICENPIGNITIFRFENNECTQKIILPLERTANDYDTQSECESHIINYFAIILTILVIIILVAGLIFLYIKTRKKHK